MSASTIVAATKVRLVFRFIGWQIADFFDHGALVSLNFFKPQAGPRVYHTVPLVFHGDSVFYPTLTRSTALQSPTGVPSQ
jgi:hypothetical protein